MNKSPLVSIVMPAYNTARYIKEAVKSVINQTYKNWELIIIDDCSPDNTKEIVQSFSDSRIKYILNSQNSGALVSRNNAIEASSGKFIAFLDSDDVWKEDKLEKQINFMQQNNFSFTCTHYELIDEHSKKLNILTTAPLRISKSKFRLWNWCGCLTVIFDAEILGKTYLENYKIRDDWALWLKISEKSDCHCLAENLAFYRVRDNSQSKSGLINLLKQHYAVFRHSEKMGVISAFFLAKITPLAYIYRKLKYVKKL